MPPMPACASSAASARPGPCAPTARAGAIPRAGRSAGSRYAELWVAALDGIERHDRLEVLYWMHEARRDLVRQSPRSGGSTGTFALRSPVRPNPIATSLVRLVAVEGACLLVRGLDCLDGTPLLDIKPDFPRPG